MASLVTAAAVEWQKIKAMAPPTDGPAAPRRAKNFPFAADKTTLRAFTANGFEDWLTRVKQAKSTLTTVKQLSEFMAWFYQTKYL
jgi:hypothetical protein